MRNPSGGLLSKTVFSRRPRRTVQGAAQILSQHPPDENHELEAYIHIEENAERSRENLLIHDLQINRNYHSTPDHLRRFAYSLLSKRDNTILHRIVIKVK